MDSNLNVTNVSSGVSVVHFKVTLLVYVAYFPQMAIAYTLNL